MSVAVTLPTSSVKFRRAFHSANKEINESVENWYHRLQVLAQPCNYGCYLDVLLLERLIIGLDEAIVDRLCLEQQDSISLSNVIELTRSMDEATDEHIVIVSALAETVRTVH